MNTKYDAKLADLQAKVLERALKSDLDAQNIDFQKKIDTIQENLTALASEVNDAAKGLSATYTSVLPLQDLLVKN